jgi:endoglucanase
MSFFWSQWDHGKQFYNGDAVRWLVNDWGVQVVRAAMGIEDGGYLDDPGTQMRRVEAIVNAAVELGVYVIIDWHDHRAEDHVEEAAAFFEAAARHYKDVPNVLFETYNEPELEQDWSQVIKPYHERMVSVIRAHNDNLIIMGSRCWCQCVDEAAADPVVGDNLAYSLHFYAGSESHRENLRNRARTAMARGVALFATEWGVCHPVEQDRKDYEESRRWLDFMAEHGISDVNWAISDKEEGCAALVPGASPTGGWSASELTEGGAFIRKTLRASV